MLEGTIAAADIVPRHTRHVALARGLMKQLDPERELVVDLSLYDDPGEPVIPIFRPGIEKISAAAVHSPPTEILLQPNGQEELHMAGAQAKLGIASRHFEQWINCNLRPPIVFGRRQETVFDPDFQVSMPIAVGSPALAL